MGDSDVNNSLPDAKVYIKVQIYDMVKQSPVLTDTKKKTNLLFSI